jgi:7-cyano-7-deazaguanine reductase
VTLSGTFSDKILRLRYIPDRDLILPTSLSTYLEAIMNDNASSLEALSQLILEDINDQLIPSWLEVSLIDKGETFTHEVRIEDRQPHWKDRGLLDRLEP